MSIHLYVTYKCFCYIHINEKDNESQHEIQTKGGHQFGIR